MSEDKNFKDALDKAKKLETIDFNTEQDIDYNDYYSAIEKIAQKNNNIKQEEAENVVSNYAKELIDSVFVEELQNKRNTVENYIRKYNPNSDVVKSLKLQDIDKIYAIFNYLLNAYIQYVNEMKFTFKLTRLEQKFLNKILTTEIKYNGDEIFNYVELYNNFWKLAQEKFENDKESDTFEYTVSIKNLLILHHLIKDYKVSGRTHDFNYFRDILYKIAQINKLFNAYNIIIERIKSDAQLWGNNLDEIAKLNDPEYLRELEERKKAQGLKDVQIKEVTDADLGK